MGELGEVAVEKKEKCVCLQTDLFEKDFALAVGRGFIVGVVGLVFDAEGYLEFEDGEAVQPGLLPPGPLKGEKSRGEGRSNWDAADEPLLFFLGGG